MVITPGIDLMFDLVVSHLEARPVVGSGVSPGSGWMSQAGGEIDAKVLARWWATLADPTLEKIVDQALARNLDLRQALAGIEGARALLARAVPIWQQTHAQIEAPLADPDRLREELNRLSRLTL